MAYELVYTSAPQGINRGSSGFCVVACTDGLGPRLIAALEGFSAYKPLYPHYADNAWDNPVSRQHYIFEANGERQHILSRICFSGVDYTGRSNKLASHLVLSQAEAERAPGGPAALLMREELFKDAGWTIRTERYDKQLTIPHVPGHEAKCSAWESVTGDAGWGGYLAQCFLDDPQRNVYLVYDPKCNRIIAELFDEAINLLPEDKRWQVTFNTYFVTLPAGGTCVWRGVPADSDAARAARRSPANIVIDLAAPGKLTATGESIDLARTGIRPKAAAPEPEPLPAGNAASPPPPADSRTGATPAAEPPPPAARKTVVRTAAKTPVRPNKPQSSSKLPVVAAAVVLLLAAIATGTFFIVAHVNGQRAYRQALADTMALRGTLDNAEQARRELEEAVDAGAYRKTLEEQRKKLDELAALAEALEEKIDRIQGTRALFDDALGSGKLADKRYMPGVLKEDCRLLKEDIQAVSGRVRDRLRRLAATEERRKKYGLEKPQPPPKPKPRPEKKAEPKPEKRPEPKPAAPKPKPKPKNLAKDDPGTVWMPAEALYSRENERSVTVALGDAAPEDIEIALLEDGGRRKTCRMSDEKTLVFTDNEGHRVTIETAYGAGKLTITVLRFPLTENRRISVSVKRANGQTEVYPLFFDVRVSKLLPGETDPRISGGNVLLEIAQLRLPKRIFDGPRKLKPGQYGFVFKCGSKTYPARKQENGTLSVTFADPGLSAHHGRLANLEKIEKNFMEAPEETISKIKDEDLKKLDRKKLEDFRKSEKELAKKLKDKKEGSLRRRYAALDLDKRNELKEVFDEWDKNAKALAKEIVGKLPMGSWHGKGKKTLRSELDGCRKKIDEREKTLRQELRQGAPALIPTAKK